MFRFVVTIALVTLVWNALLTLVFSHLLHVPGSASTFNQSFDVLFWGALLLLFTAGCWLQSKIKKWRERKRNPCLFEEFVPTSLKQPGRRAGE